MIVLISHLIIRINTNILFRLRLIFYTIFNIQSKYK